MKSLLLFLAPQSYMLMAGIYIFILATIAPSHSRVLLYLALLLAGLILAAGQSIPKTCKKGSRVLLIAAILGLGLVFTYPGERMLLFYLGNIPLSYSKPGLILWLLLMIKAFLAAVFLAFAASITPFSQLLSSLRRLGIPREMVSILLLIHRYFFIIKDEGESMVRAAKSLNFQPQNLAQAGVAGGIITNLLLRSMERSERTYQAMLARGYGGSFSAEDKSLGLADYFLLAVWITVLALIRFGGF